MRANATLIVLFLGCSSTSAQRTTAPTPRASTTPVSLAISSSPTDWHLPNVPPDRELQPVPVFAQTANSKHPLAEWVGRSSSVNRFFGAVANGDEGSLFGHREVARQFVWSSADRTVVVRAFEKRAEHRMAATRVGKSGRVEQRYERVLSSEEWGRLEQAIAEADLVHMRPVLSLSNPHGNVWALEVADQTSYRVVVRTDPEPSFRNACTAFLQIDANYISQGPVD